MTFFPVRRAVNSASGAHEITFISEIHPETCECQRICFLFSKNLFSDYGREFIDMIADPATLTGRNFTTIKHVLSESIHLGGNF